MEAQSRHGHGGFFGFGRQVIEFTDITLRESRGYYKETKKLMEEDGPLSEWMLRSSAFVSTLFVAANYMLHFWKDGRVVIYETDHLMQLDSLDEDLRELSQWCKDAGWKELHVGDRLLVNRQAYEFWRRAFIAGLIVSEKLQQHEDEEMKRLSQAYLKEKEEDENGT